MAAIILQLISVLAVSAALTEPWTSAAEPAAVEVEAGSGGGAEPSPDDEQPPMSEDEINASKFAERTALLHDILGFFVNFH